MGRPKAATMADSQLLHNGESGSMFENQVSNEVEYHAVQDSTQDHEEFVIFKLVDNTKSGGVHLSHIDDAYNEKTGKWERMRLLAGEPSIWLSEQKHITPEYARENARELHFPRGARILRIAKNDNALEFLSRCKNNIGNPKRKTGGKHEFYEYNPQKQQQEALKREMFGIEMTIKASQVPEAEMRKHAHFLGVVMFDEFGIPKTQEGIRMEYIMKAKQNPSRFNKTLGSKEVDITFMVRKAISSSLIDTGGHTGNVTWGSGGFICRVPLGRDTAEYLVELAMNGNSDEGKRFLELLQQNVT